MLGGLGIGVGCEAAMREHRAAMRPASPPSPPSDEGVSVVWRQDTETDQGVRLGRSLLGSVRVSMRATHGGGTGGQEHAAADESGGDVGLGTWSVEGLPAEAWVCGVRGRRRVLAMARAGVCVVRAVATSVHGHVAEHGVGVGVVSDCM